MKRPRPSELELQILSVLWERGPLPIREIREALPDGKDRAYTTVLTLVQILEKKGFVGHTARGQAHIYHPLVTRRQVLKPLMRDMLRNVFGGRPAEAVQCLLDGAHLDEEELTLIRQAIQNASQKSGEKKLMNAILDVLSGPAWQHLALALLHTLWQGLAAAALLWLLLRRISADRPETRYWTAFSVLMGLLLCGLATWSILDYPWPKGPASAETNADRAAVAGVAMEKTSAAPLAFDSDSASSQNNSAVAEHRPFWFALLIAAWLMGVTLMAARMAWMVGRSRRIARGPEIEDGQVRLLIEGLRRSLRVTRRLRIVETAEEFGPAVLGAVRPILVMPLSLMSGLPPDALHAILAHELAHIRRHDYLLNLLQMAIEAVLFFNPAVWWINRQIRIEREACCDAMAANALDRPLELAKALSLWADRLCARNTLAAAFANEGRHGPRLLLDRIRRILLPGYRPQLPVSPVGFLGFLAITIAVLGGLSFGTSAMVELAAKILTPAERMERIVQTQQQYAPPEDISPKGKVTLSGKIRTRGGEPVPKHVCVDRTTRSSINISSVYEGVQSPDFSVTADAGKTWLQFESEDYATAIVGPFIGKAGETISGIEVVLDKGFPIKIRVIDEKGKPVEGASVTCFPMFDNVSYGCARKHPVTDAQGAVAISYAVERNYSFSLNRAGFQPLSGISQFVKPGEPLTFTLVHAKPLRGVVLSSSGQPVAGADIREYAKFISAGGVLSGQNGTVMAVTDDQGRFVLDELVEEATYALLIVTKDQGRHLVHDVSTKQKDLRVELGPELIVSGTIHGDLGRLTKEDGKPVITYGQSVSFPHQHSENSQGGKATVEPIDGGGRFTLRGLLPGKVTVTAGDHVVSTAVEPSSPHQEVTIDLTKPAAQYSKRPVVIRFSTPDGAIPPEGTIEAYVLERPADQGISNKMIPVEKGEARFETYTPTALMYKPKGLLGYWFEEVYTGRVEPGKDPLEITVPVVPAGAIAGQILNADGTPVSENVSISVQGELRLPGRPARGRSGDFGQSNINPDAKGRFFVSPLPLGGKFTVKATRGHNIQLASPVQLDAAHPTLKLTLRFPSTTTAEGKVLDPDGRPLPRLAFELSFSSSIDKENGGSSWGGNLTTDAEGRFRIDDLGVGVGRYGLFFNSKRDFRPMRVPLPLDGKPVTAQLERGLTLEGQVIDDATGRPIAGAEIYAMPPDFGPGDFICEAEGLTDAEGRFRFSNLEDQAYRISSRSNMQSAYPYEQTWTPGEKSVVLRFKVPENSPLKRPAKP